jgi:NTP pyrophosphatase (non-canonical NTP hydrolase)
MSQGAELAPGFVERRNPMAADRMPVCERRQFANSHEELSPEAGELARAIDQYKLHHRRRFITFEEMLAVVKSLGYHRD